MFGHLQRERIVRIFHRILHLRNISSHLRVGARVTGGDPIAWSNDTGKSTGPHVHYDLSDENGTYLDPTEEFSGCRDQ